MEEEGIVGLSIRDQPSHGSNNVGLGRLHHGVGLIIGQDDHVLALVSVTLNEESRDIVDIVDTAAKLTILAKVVDTDQQGLAFTCTVGVLECVTIRGTVTELLRNRWRRRAGTGVGGIARLLERIPIGIESLRRRMLRGGISVVSTGTSSSILTTAILATTAAILTTTAAILTTTTTILTAAAAAIVSAIVSGWRTRRRSVAAAAAVLLLLRISPALITSVMALAWVVRHDAR